MTIALPASTRAYFGVIFAALTFSALPTLPSAVAAEATTQHYRIPADLATVSLKAFQSQSGQEIVYRQDTVADVHTNAIEGTFSPEDALRRILAGTELIATRSQGGLFVIKRASDPKGDRAALRSSGRPGEKEKPGEETIQLDPFEVNTARDTSYGALNSNSVTRFDTELSKLPISADIFTESFMQDVGATSINDMLLKYGAGMGQVFAVPGAADANQPGDRVLFNDRFTPTPMGARGLSAGYIRRDGFAVSPTNKSSTDNFDVERVEVLHGPQALLYGAGGAGGTITTTSKQAHFDQVSGLVSEKIDQYGSKRTLLDFNAGNDKFAIRLDTVRSDQQQRRLDIEDLLEGYYGQAAVLLPLHTTLRVNAEYTKDSRIFPTSPSVNFGSTAADPRNGYNLGYLILTNQTGANNPATGQAYSKFGAIDNGYLNFKDYNSYAGWREVDDIQNSNYTVNVDTVFTPWLSTNVGLNLNRMFFTGGQNVSALTAPLIGGNPFNDWAVNSNMNETTNAEKRKQYHASALVTKELFSGRIKTQTVVGAESEWYGTGVDDYGYYLSDANGNLITTTSPSNLGRTHIPNQWWNIGSGPVKQPLSAMEAPVILGQDGKYYARVEQNPRSPMWINANNPLGIASLSPLTSGVSGLDVGNYGKQYKTDAYYLGDYSSWWNDLVTSLVGVRYTKVGNHVANGSAAIGSTISSVGYDDSQQKNTSYNFGLDGKLTDWLRWYISGSSTYNSSIGFDDYYGNPPPVGRAVGQEAGLKFSYLSGGLSGSLDYYQSSATGQNVSNGTILNLVNPVGLNGGFNGTAGRDSWVPLDQKSNGVELILTAAPTKNWRIRFSATASNGTVQTTKSYGMLYNDQFYTDGKGNVTYQNGSPFLVPVDATKVAALNGSVDPGTLLAGLPTQQLTTAMMGDPSSDYYAWGKGNPQALNGQVTATSDVGRALTDFNKPGVGTALTGATGLPISSIQYAWSDPGNTHGTQTVFQAGDDTTGYPVYRVSLTSAYEFSHGLIKGLGGILALNDAWKWRTYYYTDPSNARILFTQPQLGWQADFNLYYKRKFGRIMWRIQLDTANLTNHYKITVTPSATTGFTNPLNEGIRWDGYPRSYALTNTFTF